MIDPLLSVKVFIRFDTPLLEGTAAPAEMIIPLLVTAGICLVLFVLAGIFFSRQEI